MHLGLSEVAFKEGVLASGVTCAMLYFVIKINF